MSIMDQIADDSGGVADEKESALVEKVKVRKQIKKKLSSLDVSSTKRYTKEKREKKIKDSPFSSDNERKSIKEKGMTAAQKKNTIVSRSVSPGLDLSVFQPRGKRKCVIQNESKKRKDDWWSEDEAGEKDEESEEEIIDAEVDHIKKPVVQKKRKRAIKPDKKVENCESVSETAHKTVRCYVFSTGMANRAGHYVTKGAYKTIGAYHHAQSWDTPYLNAEVHCRPFHPDLEEEEEAKNLAGGLDLGAVKTPNDTDSIKPSFSEPVKMSYELSQTRDDSAPLVSRERTLSVNSWQKEQVIEAARHISRINGHDIPEKQLETHSSQQSVSNAPSIVDTSSIMDKTDSDSSPAQTVPKSAEPVVKEEVKLSLPTFRMDDIINLKVEKIRKKDLGSPPQLVPTFKHETNENGTNNSYPADITNVKEQLHYHSPKPVTRPEDAEEYHVRNMIDNRVRPTVLSMAGDRHENETGVRSSIDVAEKALKESRSVYKPGAPILPRDIHPSIFLSRHSPQIHTSLLNGHPPTSSFPSRLPFSPTTSRTNSSFHKPHDIHAKHHVPVLPPSHYRHGVHSAESYRDTENLEEKFKYNSIHHSALSNRPSSQPVLRTAHSRSESFPPKSFSVKSFTEVHDKLDKREKDMREEPDKMRIPLNIPDRHPIPEHLHKNVPGGPERIHIPSGINIHNGLKRSLDEQLSSHIMERVEHEKYHSRLHDERFLRDKERFLFEKDRFVHHPRYSFPEHRMPLRMPSSYQPRTNGSEHSDLPSPPHLPTPYSHLRRLHPYSFPSR